MVENAYVAIADKENDEEKIFYPRNTNPWTGYLLYCAFSSTLGSLLFGFGISALNTPKSVIQHCAPGYKVISPYPECMDMNSFAWGLLVAIPTIGGLIGSILAGNLTAKGRIRCIGLANVWFILGSICQFMAVDQYMLILGRFFFGIGCGMSITAASIYLSEISPTKIRGAMGTTNQLAIVSGIMIVSFISIPFSSIKLVGGFAIWRWLLLLPVGVSVLQVFLLQFVTESPKYVLIKEENQGLSYEEKMKQVKLVLCKLREVNWDIEEDIESLGLTPDTVNKKNDDDEADTVTVKQLLGMDRFKKQLVVGVVIQLSQQLSGVNIVFQYSTDLFKGIFGGDSKLMSAYFGVWNVFCTLVSTGVIDKGGRRLLLLGGQFTIVIVSVTLMVGQLYKIAVLSAVSVFIFVAAFAVGLGPIPWMIVPELFPERVIGPAISFISPWNYASSFTVSLILPVLQDALGRQYVFIPFMTITFILGVFLSKKLPETKGKTIKEVMKLFNGGPNDLYDDFGNDQEKLKSKQDDYVNVN